MAAFAAKGFSFADGILARIIQTRGNVSRVVICGKMKESYLVTNGTAWSHGDTLRAARDGLLYKIGSRDTTPYKKWKLKTKVKKHEAVQAYRVITGACESGTRHWMEQHKTPAALTVNEIIKLTKGAYGNKKFAEFFK
jgi:hypothetical protein